MFLKKTLPLALLLFTLVFLFPKNTFAADTVTSGETVLTTVQEAIQYFFTFKTENKVQVLENNAEKRLVWAEEYANKSRKHGSELFEDKRKAGQPARES